MELTMATDPSPPLRAGDRGSTVVQTFERLLDTQLAFDSVAADYDGPRGNNALIQRMRETIWHTLERTFAPAARLLDLGCGTGLDAVHLARLGYAVVATDWSPRMVERTRARAAAARLADRVTVVHVGIHELDRFQAGLFDGIYSNFGPLNCAPDLAAVSRACAAQLKPGGTLVFSVIGRVCPWEFAYYTLRGRHERARVRGRRGMVPVGMNKHTIWSFYYTPREFYRSFASEFSLTDYQGLSVLLPPPYLVELYERHRSLFGLLGRLDDLLGGWPLLRNIGDHFLIVMTMRSNI
jgi:SAM-dependent methyltransferase